MNPAAARSRVAEIVAEIDGSMGVAAWTIGDESSRIALNADTLLSDGEHLQDTDPLFALPHGRPGRGRPRSAYRDHRSPPGSRLRRHPAFAPGLQPTIYDLAMLMTIVSDNEATDILHQLVGVQRMHADLDELGLDRIRVPLTCRELLYSIVGMDATNPNHTYEMFREKSRNNEYDRDGIGWSDEEGSGNDLTPPDQMAQLCEYIEQGVGLSDTAREGILDTMKRQTLNSRIPAGVPEGVTIAHKTGSLRGVRNDAGIVYAEKPYVIAIFSKHLQDEDAGVQAMIEISRTVWNALGDGEDA
ncbi:MAG: serine hydrolase [Thermomicrobiales bacterium]